jgi:hypothetical protein
MGGKIEKYTTSINEPQLSYQDEYKAVKLNRIEIVPYDIQRVAKYPLGFGINDRVSFEGVDVTGDNGITGLMRMWGFFIFIFFIICLFKYHLVFNYANLAVNEITFIFSSLMVVYFSQSIQYNILTYILIFSAIVFKPTHETKNFKH